MTKNQERFSLFIPIEPVSKLRARVVAGRAFTPEKTRRFEAQLKIFVIRHLNLVCAKEKLDFPWNEPLKLEIVFKVSRPKSVKRNFPTVKPDGSNLLKAVEDALNTILWHDDAQIITWNLAKRYAENKKSVGIHLTVSKVSEKVFDEETKMLGIVKWN